MKQSGDGQNRVVREYDWGMESPSFSVIDAIARFEGEETSRMAEQLSPRLADVLDTDALDSLLTSDDGLALEFEYASYHVKLEGGTVEISDQATPHRHSP